MKPLAQIYQQLLTHYGTQQWWPAESPFEVMVGAILTQNTAWENVQKAIDNLKKSKMLSAEQILKADIKRLAEQLKPSGYFNIKARRLTNFCRWYLEQGGLNGLSQLPTEPLRRGLLSVNGVGPETADDILLYAFERPIFVIDAYTRRIFSRVGLIEGDEGYEHLREWFEEGLAEVGGEAERVVLFSEYHALIVTHAKAHCRKKALCSACPVSRLCPQGRAVVA